MASAQNMVSAGTLDQLVDQSDRKLCCEKYRSKVRNILEEAFSPEVILRVLVEDSSASEAAIGLRKNRGQYEVFRIVPVFQLWWFEHPHLDMLPRWKELYPDLPDKIADVPLVRCAAVIDDETAHGISDAWKSMLSSVTKDQPVPGVDGVSFYFSMKGVPVTGVAWSPQGDSRVAKLVALADTMRAYCNEPTWVSRNALREAVTAFAES